MKYLVLFICSMIIPAMNTSAVSIALSNNIRRQRQMCIRDRILECLDGGFNG